MPDFDLATVKARRGTKKPLYTLQIAVYGRPDNTDATKEDLAQFRKSAEEAVVQLRREGEQAYYYHGPNRSMVTVGIFSEDDAGFGKRIHMGRETKVIHRPFIALLQGATIETPNLAIRSVSLRISEKGPNVGNCPASGVCSCRRARPRDGCCDSCV